MTTAPKPDDPGYLSHKLMELRRERHLWLIKKAYMRDVLMDVEHYLDHGAANCARCRTMRARVREAIITSKGDSNV